MQCVPNFQLNDAKRVLDCLKKGVKIASQVMDLGTKVQVKVCIQKVASHNRSIKTLLFQLLVELLNKYIFFLEKGVASVQIEMIQELIDRIREDSPNLEANDEGEQIGSHFANTLAHIKARMAEVDGSGGPNYKDLKL